MDDGKTTHRIDWTAEKIREFWAHFERQPGRENISFARQRGRAVLRHVSRTIELRGDVLDFGCGAGYLIDELIAYSPDVRCSGTDFSACSLDLARARLGSDPRAADLSMLHQNARSTYADATFDLVFLIETIEHLTADQGRDTIREIARVLRPGGRLVCTTPNGEDLERNSVTCPSCSCRFHRVQHLVSWTPGGLAARIEEGGLEVTRSSAAFLRPDLARWRAARRDAAGWPHRCPDCTTEFPPAARSLFQKLRKWKTEMSHLICIAQKPA